MPKLTTKDGFTFEGTEAECWSWYERLNRLKASTPHKSVPADPITPMRQRRYLDSEPQPLLFDKAMVDRVEPLRVNVLVGEVIKFLLAVKNHTAGGGLTGDDLVPVLGVSHPKGVGSRLGPINKAIETVGFRDLREVYTNDRDSSGTRRWKAGPKMDDALTAFDRFISQGVTGA